MRLRRFLPPLALAAVIGCDSILDTDPVDRIPLDQAITNGVSARSALVGAYDALQSLSYYGRNFLVVSDLASDNADHQGTLTALGDVDRNELRADNTTVAGVWGAIYAGIARVNLILQRVPSVPGLDDDERNQILGEAHFLRALHYHNLVKYWDGVPMPLQPVSSPDEAADYTRASVDAIYTQIVNDLEEAAELMDPDVTAKLTASPGAVDALMSRVLLYKGDWAGTIAAANRHADDGGHLPRALHGPGVQRAGLLLPVQWPVGDGADGQPVQCLRDGRRAKGVLGPVVGW
jgi:hypothetical protein